MKKLYDITIQDLTFTLVFEKEHFTKICEIFRDRAAENLKLPPFVFEPEKEVGIGGALKFLSKDDMSHSYTFKSDEPQLGECSYCKGSGKDIMKNQCRGCKGEGKRLSSDLDDVDDFTKTIQCICHYGLNIDLHDLRKENIFPEQSIEIELTLTSGRFNCGISGILYNNLIEWIKSLSKEQIVAIEKEVQQSVTLMHERVYPFDDNPSTQIHLQNIRYKDPSWAMHIPGNGVWMSSGSSDRHTRYGRQFSSHNVDYRGQQMALLAGVVKLNTLYREHKTAST